MADPIPYVMDLCSSQQSIDTYIQYLNHALSMTLNVVNEELGEEFELPGIPPITLPNSPDIFLPGWGDWERKLRLRNTPVPKGYTGNVFPLRQIGKRVDGKLVLPGVPDILVGAPPTGVVPGVDPSTHIIKFLNQNIEILFKLVNEAGVEVVPIMAPFMELCPGQSEGASPGQILLNQLLDQNLNTAIEAASSACSQLVEVIDTGDTDCWVSLTQPGGISPPSVGGNGVSLSHSATVVCPAGTNQFGDNFLGNPKPMEFSNRFTSPASPTALYKSAPCQPRVCSANGLRFTANYAIDMTVSGDLSGLTFCSGAPQNDLLSFAEFQFAARIGRVLPDNTSVAEDLFSTSGCICERTSVNGPPIQGCSCTETGSFSESGVITLEIPAGSFADDHLGWVEFEWNFAGSGLLRISTGTCGSPGILFGGNAALNYSQSLSISNMLWTVI